MTKNCDREKQKATQSDNARWWEHISQFMHTHQVLLGFTLALLTAVAGIAGVWFTYLAIEKSSEHVQNQLTQQKKATSISIVNDFFSVLGEHIDNDFHKMEGSQIKGKKSNKHQTAFNRATITRAQLLLDNLEFPDLKAQVISYLGRAGHEHLFDRSKSRKISLTKVDLTGGDISDIKIHKAYFHCTVLPTANLSMLNNCSGEGTKSDACGEKNGLIFQFTDMSATKLDEAILTNSYFQWVNLSGAAIAASDFSDAKITFSDLRGLKWIKEKYSNPDNSPSTLSESDLKNIALTLSKAQSLYGSILDKELHDALEKVMRSNKDGRSIKDLLGKVALAEPGFAKILEPTWKKDKDDAKNNWCKTWFEKRNVACEAYTLPDESSCKNHDIN